MQETSPGKNGGRCYFCLDGREIRRGAAGAIDNYLRGKAGGILNEVTISSKFQVVIPRAVRNQLKLKAGQKLRVVLKGGMINLVPEVPIMEMRGFLKGMDISGIRDEDERL